VGNALKYTPPGGSVTVSTRPAEGGSVLEVSDTGPGVPEGERAELFQRFSVGSARATGGEPSTGLGLYICREIVESHGGRIWYEPRAGGGSTFLVFLKASPLRGAGGRSTSANAPASRGARHSTGSSRAP
jgi:signal transduction histidine kinase